MNKITWEYYNSHFPKVSEKAFDALKYKAEREVTKRLPKREFTEDEKTDIQDCICEVLNEFDLQNKSNGVSSTSNDGYSESYVNKSAEEQKESINSIIDKWVGYMIPKFIGF